VSIENEFTFVKGRKHSKDVILQYEGTPGLEHVAFMMLHFINNDEAIYPQEKGFRGGELPKEYFTEVLETGKIPDKDKYMLGGKLTILKE
jgi:hypothetical protein